MPFAALAWATVAGGPLPRGAAVSGLILYAAVILSFMGGAQWGLAISTTQGGATAMGRRLAISVLPALAGFGSWYLPETAALLGLASAFIALLVYDIATTRSGIAPNWYPVLRIQLTGAVVLCLVITALIGGR